MATHDQHPADQPPASWQAPRPESIPVPVPPPAWGRSAWRARGARRMAPVLAGALLLTGGAFAGGVAVGHGLDPAQAATSASQGAPGDGDGFDQQGQLGAPPGMGPGGDGGSLPPGTAPESEDSDRLDHGLDHHRGVHVTAHATEAPPAVRHDEAVPAHRGDDAVPGAAAGSSAPLAALLVATAVLYLWDLGASGWANAYYAAAAQAGSESWKALFFGSFDAADAITVDKTPASLWVMALSMRIFGVSSWSLLVPQALMGVATVALVWATVRRWFSPAAALVAGAAMAVTPVAALMFRFDNPDALLVLLLTGAAYAVVRAVERGGARWLMLAGALVGFGFLAKMLQAFLVVPAFALVYLVAAPNPLRTRLLHLVGAGVAMVAASAWWVAIVELWPASSPPVHRRLAGQQRAGAGDRLQRPRPADRRRGRVGRRRRSRGRRRLGRDRHRAVVQRRGRRPDRVAAAGRPRPARGRVLARRAGAAHRPAARRGPALGRLAGRHRPGVQPDGRHLPRVLHRGPGTRDRRPGGHRRR